MIWEDNDINRFAVEAEQEISRLVNCINVRYAIPIVGGTIAYELPEAILSIRQITWRGKIIDPLSIKEYAEFKMSNPMGDPLIGTPTPNSGQPLWYFHSGFQENWVRFFPAPTETISGDFDDLYGEDIANAVICEFWALPDFTEGSTQHIPPYIGRRLIKSYVLYKCLLMEGPGQDLEASKFFKDQFDFGISIFTEINNNLFFSKPSEMGEPAQRYKLARPMLKSKYTNF